MIIISDSPTYLLEKVAISRGIKKVKFINFPCSLAREDFENIDSVLILLSEVFYKPLGIPNKTFDDLKLNSLQIFDQLEKLIIDLNDLGIWIYISKVPKHFIHGNQGRDYFYEKDSKDFFIDYINFKFNSYSIKYNNLCIIKGIQELKPQISKTYFRFSSIYDRANSLIILEQVLEHKKKLNLNYKKLIVLDLDNTLWKGILGDDFKEGIRMDQSDPIGCIFYEVQKILLNYKSKGFLLAICSKNDEHLALEALFNSPSSQFTSNDIVTHRINWHPKSENIIDICKELNISPQETIFLDDNSYECDEVQNNCPEISVISVPKDLYSYPHFLISNPLFSTSQSTQEDKERTELYKNRILKKKLFEETISSKGSKEEWIKSLDMKLKLSLINENNKNIDRTIQLFNRTNQFNLSGSKYNKKSFIAEISKNNKYYYYGFASDRISSEGIISVLGFSFNKNKIKVEDFIVSCRVFGRNIEQSMLIPLICFAQKRLASIEFNYVNTNRNDFIKRFLINEYSGFFITNENLLLIKEKYKNLNVNLIDYDNNFFKEKF